jgi:hypothetical protein
MNENMWHPDRVIFAVSGCGHFAGMADAIPPEVA